MATLCYRPHRFPAEVIQHAIWLYLRFTLSYRDVEELLAERGLDISYETVRRWMLKFGPAIARRLRQRRHRPSDRWHLDEMVVRIAGERMYLWRAVDHEGEVLDMLVQSRCDGAALRPRQARRGLMRKLLKKQGFAPKCWSPTSCAPTLRRSAISGWPVRMSRGSERSASWSLRAKHSAIRSGRSMKSKRWFTPLPTGSCVLRTQSLRHLLTARESTHKS
jgi:transposase-like protein